MATSPPVALITGAGSGIGRETAIELARRRWRLVLVGRTESKLDATASRISQEISEEIEFMSSAIDLTEPGVPEAVVDAIGQHLGRLDALINNAGVVELMPLANLEEDALSQMFQVNTFVPLRLIAAAWPLFERTVLEDPEARPCVVNISSMSAANPFPGLGPYGMSKAALEASARAIRSERGEMPLRAFNIAPGAVETPLLRSLFDESILSTDRTLDPRVVAAEIVACIEGDRDDRDGQTITLASP